MQNLNILKTLILSLFFITLAPDPPAFAGLNDNSPYEFSILQESIIFVSAGGIYLGSFFINKHRSTLSDSEIEGLSRSEVNPFDRSATRHWSRRSDRMSDYSNYIMILMPAAFLCSPTTRNDISTISLLYVETLLMEMVITNFFKILIARKRPYVYNPDVPIENKRGRDAIRSFPSGHTSSAAAGAVFTSTIFARYFPNSSWIIPIWAATLSLAGTVGYLRYRAGMHYPTDIIAGAAIGSAVGFGIPAIHERRDSQVIVSPAVSYNGESSFSLTASVHF